MSATTKTQQEVMKLRGEIEKLREEIEWLDTALVTKAELKARAAKGVRDLAEQFGASRHLSALGHPGAGASELSEMFSVLARVFTMGREVDVTRASSELGPMLAWAMGDDLVARMHAEIDAMDYRPGPPMGERPARLAELKKSLRELEQREEALICQAEESGTYIARRADADPEVVLAYAPEGDGSALALRGPGRPAVAAPQAEAPAASVTTPPAPPLGPGAAA